MRVVEACVDSVESALAAERGGAHRLELCDNLHDGGTTPSAGMLAAVKEHVHIPVFVLVRPRGGGFVYSEHELDVIRRDVASAVRLGADGLVLGVLRHDATVDVGATRSVVAAAEGRPITFHRAFDLAPHPIDALAALSESGVTRVLTSGGATTAVEGADTIRALVAAAPAGLAVMAGGGVREENVVELVRSTGVREIHIRGTRLRGTEMAPVNPRIRLRKPFPADEGAWEETDEARVRLIVALSR